MKNILIITQSFAPRNAVASIRFTKVAKYLARTGEYNIHVIAESAPLGEPQDDILKKDIESIKDNITVHLINNQRIGKKIKTPTKSIPSGTSSTFWVPGEKIALKTRLKGRYFFHYQKTFSNKAYQAAKNIIAKTKIDAMITTYGGIGSTVVGLKIKQKYPDINWINDYRDPIRAKTPALVKASYKIATKADSICNSITGASSSYFGTNTHPEKFHIITNSCDPEDLAEIKATPSNKFQICFTGTFYPKKFEADTLCQILSDLISEKIIDKNNLIISLAGKNTHEIAKTASKYALSEVIEEKGFIPRPEALSLQKSSDLLCFFLWNESESKDIIAGKIMEYTMMDRPIACFIRGSIGQSFMKKTIRDNHLGECFEEAEKNKDFYFMKKYIEDLYQRKMMSGEISQENSKDIKYKFSAEYMAQKFRALL